MPSLAKLLYHYKDFVWLDSSSGGGFSLIGWEAVEEKKFTAAMKREFSQFLQGIAAQACDDSHDKYLNSFIACINYEAALFVPDLPEDIANFLEERAGNEVLALFKRYDTLILQKTPDSLPIIISRDPKIESQLSFFTTVDRGFTPALPEPPTQVGRLQHELEKSAYERTFSEIKEEISAGRYYEINFSQQFKAPFAGSALELYLELRKNNPAPMGALIKKDYGAILSVSPESFFKIENGKITTLPIKGTKATNQGDEKKLLVDPKEKAELLMVTDLLRNDLGKVCESGSIEVKGFPVIESHTHYHHLHAEICGTLIKDWNFFKIFAALFPGGSITGAPKFEVMRAISRHEKRKRGIYTGIMGLLGQGFSSFNIAIRTIEISGNNLSFATGGGIVYDSICENEYEECFVKSRGIRAALDHFK